MARLRETWSSWRPGPGVCIVVTLVVTAACVGHQLVGPAPGTHEAILVWVPIPVTMAGFLVWRRRPGVLAGPVFVLIGLFRSFYMLGTLSFEPLPFTVALVFDRWFVPLLLAAYLSFPARRLGRFDWAIVWTSALCWIVLRQVTVPFLDLRDFGCPPELCPDGLNLLLVDSRPDLVRWIDRVWIGGVVVTTLATFAVLLRRLIRASAPARRVLLPLMVPVLADLATDAFQSTVEQVAIAGGGTAFNEWSHDLRLWAEVATAFLVPVGLVVGTYLEARRRERVGELASDPEGLRDGVRRALGDPTADVVRGVEPPVALDGRVITPVRSSGTAVGWLVHDDAAGDDPRLLAAVTAIAGLVLDAQRQVERLGDALADVEASRRRLLDAGERARRQVERELELGPVAQLESALRATAEADPRSPAALQPALRDVRHQIRQAIGELRDLVQGLAPPLLSERGLAPALEDLAAGAAVAARVVTAPSERFEQEVEATAWFVAAEALVNAAKHADAGSVEIRAQIEGDQLVLTISDDGSGGARPDGHGLTGLAERVRSIGGTLQVDSAPGAGTTVTAAIPVTRAAAMA